jgi:hypothetical protein
MVCIRDNSGNVVRQSKNLRAIVRELGQTESPVKALAIDEFGKCEGKLCILWENRRSVETNFASFAVLRDWVYARRNLKGAPIRINGVDSGKI